MTPGLVEALEAGTAPGREADDADGVAERARRRARRGRRSRTAAWAGAGVAVVWAAATVLPGLDRGDPAPPAPVQTVTATMFAEDLTATVVERARDVAARAPAQRAVLCSVREGGNPWAASSDRNDLPVRATCSAAWAGSEPLIAIDRSSTTVTTFTGDGRAIITVDWAVRNRGSAALALDAGGVLVSLLTDPGEVTTDRGFDEGRYAGGSLWASNTQRYATLSGTSRPVTVEPGEYVQGSTRFIGREPGRGEPRDAVWDIATGADAPTVGVQVRVQPFGISGTRELFLEAEAAVPEPAAGVSADTLVADLTPRLPGERRDGAQAALLCEVPPDLRAEPGGSFPYAAGEAACEAGWLPTRIVADAGTLGITAGDVAPLVGWGVLTATTGSLEVAGWRLLVEQAPDDVRDAATPLRRLGSSVVTARNAWAADGRRIALLDNADVARDIGPGEEIGGHDSLFPAMLTDGEPIDVSKVVAAIEAGGTVTAQVDVPFLGDPSRVLILETPLALAGAEPAASP
ncbi:hypothetical protein [Demequina iriomotensis]|uniref:hypothetical protein n=1 Tax=Demequina iriomotensis TaxID=1536641 RepID=UPI00078465EE|nr:hypothetical protein [Demequina iriomotensis]